jgi:hypothetical protein
MPPQVNSGDDLVIQAVKDVKAQLDTALTDLVTRINAKLDQTADAEAIKALLQPELDEIGTLAK